MLAVKNFIILRTQLLLRQKTNTIIMKKLTLLLLFLSVSAFAQKEMPNVTIKSVNNKSYNVKSDFAEKRQTICIYLLGHMVRTVHQ